MAQLAVIYGVPPSYWRTRTIADWYVDVSLARDVAQIKGGEAPSWGAVRQLPNGQRMKAFY